MRDTSIDLQKSGPYKFWLRIEINFICSEDADEECVIHLKSSNTELMTYDNEIFDSLFLMYTIGSETAMGGSNLIFYSDQLLYSKCHKITFQRGRICRFF